VTLSQESLFEKTSKVFVQDLKPGDTADSVFAVTHMALKTYAGGRFIQLKLGDCTGRMAAVLWNDAETVYTQFQVGDLVHVRGPVEIYREKPQLAIRKIKKIEDTDSLDPDDFLPSSDINVEHYQEALKRLAETVENHWLRDLIESFFKDGPLMEAFLRAPAGKQWHHGYLGGLVEHTVGVAENCAVLAERYSFVKRDILITGAIFHDIGKIFEYIYSTVIDFSDPGRLIGHQVLGDQKLCEYAASIENFPEDILMELRHLVLSHHGDTADAVRSPQTREALILSRSDDLDAQMNAFSREILKARAAGRTWSDYVNLIGRYLYDSGGSDEEPAIRPAGSE